MNDSDHVDLDGRLLQLLVAVVEEGSVTRAAQRLDVTQSAVSHLLDKLRAIVHDPIVVRSGRGVVPTARAEALAVQARRLLAELRSFATASAFEPSRYTGTVTIAANDLQRELLLPRLARQLRRASPGLALRIVPSGAPTPELLRDAHCDLLITPRPPEAADLMHKRLFEDGYRVFYDPACRTAPRDLDDYLHADHVTVLHHDPRRRMHIDDVLSAQGVQRRIAVEVPGFAGIAAFLRGTPLLATMPGLLRANLLAGFAQAELPLPTPPMPMYLVWHVRHHEDGLHRWLRGELFAVTAAALAEVQLPEPVAG